MWSLLLHPRSLNSKNAIAAASRSCIFAQFIIAFNLRNESRVTGMSALPSSHLLWVNPPFLCAQGCCYVYAVFTVHRGYYTQSLLYTRITIHSLFYTLYTVRDIHSGGLQTIYMQRRIQIQYTVHSGFCTHTVDIIICSFFANDANDVVETFQKSVPPVFHFCESKFL